MPKVRYTNRGLEAGGQFHTLCEIVEVPHRRFHDTPHTCGTLLHVQGAAPFIIQKVLGHSQLSTTKRYTHVPVEITGAALDGLDALLRNGKKRCNRTRLLSNPR